MIPKPAKGLNACFLFTLFTVLFCCTNLFGQTPDRFKLPADSDKVITYWMFMNGNITKHGITKDLEAMKAAGVNGTLFFSVGFYKPGPVKFMSEQWWDAVGHAMRESDRLKMKFGIYNSDGWSMSGGPWITPKESMQQIVWADTLVNGGRAVQLKLPQPQINNVYDDIAIVAFPVMPNEAPIPVKKVISTQLVIDRAPKEQPATNLRFLPSEAGKKSQIVVDFGKFTNLRRMVLDKIAANPFLEATVKLEYSRNGKDFTAIPVAFPVNLKAESNIKQVTCSFAQVNARYMRISLNFEASTTKPVPIAQNYVDLGKIAFYASPRMNLWEPKSGESKRIRHERQAVFMHELNASTNENLPRDAVIAKSREIDLTHFTDSNGVLSWKAPAGKWVIQRIGYTSTLRMVGPATKEGKGYECNKMDAKAVQKHFDAYSGKIINLSERLLGRPIDYIQMESWEAGIQNWTRGFEKEFLKRNGYSILPYLPVLAGGYVVESYSHSNKFLWDFRNTVSQLIAENYWGTMYKAAKARGVTISGEGSGMQHYLYDPMRYQQYLDIPMGEFWPNEGHVRADVKNASSVAHTYGRNLAGAESFTSGDVNLWSVTPFKLKQIGDEAFALGTNHIVLHTYVHQPYDVGPGFTLSKFGNHLQRLNPWYTKAQGWFTYLARCQYMLRQGKNVQGLAYFTGEGVPSYLGLPWELHPKLPKGYDYDGVNIDIIKKMQVKDGELFLPGGAHYQLLIFQDITQMSTELMLQIKRLVSSGATIVSLKPRQSPTLVDNNTHAGYGSLANEIWANIDGVKVKQRRYGKGIIYAGTPVSEILAKLNKLPDFIYKPDSAGTVINFVHKQTSNTDIYFLANHEKAGVKIKALFNVNNKVPELWDADFGTRTPVKYRQVNSRQMELSLSFNPLESKFIVFDYSTASNKAMPAPVKETGQISMNKPWKVVFNSKTDTLNTTFEKLTDWSSNADPRIKYFSGSATYSQQVEINKSVGTKFMLNLGNVNEHMVTVRINGTDGLHFWKPPYVMDIAPYIHDGKNLLEITVTNTAVNSLIGDERYAADVSYDKNALIEAFPSWLTEGTNRGSKRKNLATYKYITKDTPLEASGMMGPVQISILK